MNDKFFIDTNIFIYCFDTNEPEKCRRANELVKQGLSEDIGAISYQVVQEFLNVALQKFDIPLTTEDALLYLESVLRPLCYVFPDIEMYKETCDIKVKTGFSFYDCLIIAAAKKSDCAILYSEDFQHGYQIGETQIINPFIV